MKQEAFEALHGPAWEHFEETLAQALRARRGEGLADLESLPLNYRQICHHLALARERQYSAGLVDRLNGLVLAGHQCLYGSRRNLRLQWLRYAYRGFPALVRSRWRSVALAALLFFGPTVALSLAVPKWPELAYYVESPQSLANMESMYQSGPERFGRKNASDTDLEMFGFYIWNNIRIDFQAFASGVVLGFGPILFLFWNGVHGGAVAGHLTRVGLGKNFWSFVITHSALEVTALVLAGAAGLGLGYSLLAPGRYSRREALRKAGSETLPLILGAGAMTGLAAFLEAFWSASAAIPPSVKFAAGGGLWALVAAYFLFAGRGRSRAGGRDV